MYRDDPFVALAIHEEAVFAEVQEAALFLFELLEGMALKELREAEAKQDKKPTFGDSTCLKQIEVMTEAKIIHAKITGAYNLLNNV